MKAVWMFSGQGAQTVGMGKDLYDGNPSAKKVFDDADGVLGYAISQVCFDGPEEKLMSSIYCQSAIYTMSMACLAAFRAKFPQATPVAAAGLSLGEYAALASSGCFSFADGLTTVTKRGQLMDKACSETNGTMASILGGNLEDIEAVCRDLDIDVANYNCPGQTVISGPVELVEKAAAELKNRGVKRAVVLKVAGAFHSRLMKTAGDALRDVLAPVTVHPFAFPVAQNFTGKITENVAEVKENLVSQVAGSVRWEDGIRAIVEKTGADTFIEFGPGNVLTGLVRRIVPEAKLINISSVATLDAVESLD